MINKTTIEKLPAHQERDQASPRALEGIRVIDFTHYIAGPLATMMLADFGADVLKVESTECGDLFRYYPPNEEELVGQGAPYIWANRNKRSLAINLKSERGLDIVKRLISNADVLIENFSSGVMARLGLSYSECTKENERLIYCTISAYGREGEFADRPGFDTIAQAESGFMSLNGYPDRPGVKTLSPVVDISTAMMACNAVLAALLARNRTGSGQLVELALFDTAVMLNGYATTQYLLSGKVPQRASNFGSDTSPTGVFQACDKKFYLNCGSDGMFQRICEVAGLQGLVGDPRFQTTSQRIENRDELFQLLDQRFLQHDWAHWQIKLKQASIPAGEMRSLVEAIESKEMASRGLLSRIPHPKIDWLPNVAVPIRLNGTPLSNPVAAPRLGQHTAEILKQFLNCEDSEIEELARAGVLRDDR
jgi:crotonobetainyl-CoA:carnitine CoA-transferase CaiB-like acyl-CoA transferase